MAKQYIPLVEQWLRSAQSLEQEERFKALELATLIPELIQPELLFWLCSNTNYNYRVELYRLLDEHHRQLLDSLEVVYLNDSIAPSLTPERLRWEDKDPLLERYNRQVKPHAFGEAQREERDNWRRLLFSADKANHRLALELLPTVADYVQDYMVLWYAKTLQPYYQLQLYICMNAYSKRFVQTLADQNLLYLLHTDHNGVLPPMEAFPELLPLAPKNNLHYMQAAAYGNDLLAWQTFLYMEYGRCGFEGREMIRFARIARMLSGEPLVRCKAALSTVLAGEKTN